MPESAYEKARRISQKIESRRQEVQQQRVDEEREDYDRDRERRRPEGSRYDDHLNYGAFDWDNPSHYLNWK